MNNLKTASLFALSLAMSATAFAGWGANEDRLGGANGKMTWVYTPDSTIAGNPHIIDGKRALMVNLHGCAQSNEDLKDGGNWPEIAEEYGMVVAIPFAESAYPGCWDYNLANDDSNHAAILVDIVNELVANSSLNIDANQVYVSGLSSGGAMTVQLACEYPHVFAGIGSMAGPSVGSDQDGEALGDTPAGNVTRGINKCNELANASGHAADLQTQISSMVFGDIDRNGNGVVGYGQGTISLVDVNWVSDNAEIMKDIYGSAALGNTVSIVDEDGATADESISSVNGNEVVSLLGLNSVGHAWPTGDKSAEWANGGAYVNKSGFEYPRYLTDWLFTNNRRAVGGTGGGTGGGEGEGEGEGGETGGTNTAPALSVASGPYNYEIGASCVPSATATDAEDGDLSSSVSISGSADCNTAGSYSLTYNVIDSEGESDSATITVTVNAAAGGFDEEATATCTGHYSAGRLNVTGYLSCGSANGYTASVTLYSFGGCWTEDVNGGGC